MDYLEPRGLPIAEFAAVLVFAVTGAMLIAGSTDLVLLFVALELMVLPGYMLAGFARRDPYSTEGAIKYFLLGSFSSAILLFGLAYVWGITGTTRVDGVTAALAKVAAGGSIQPGPGHGPGLHVRRRGFQDGRRTVPLLDSGRIPGLAHADYRLSLGRPEGRRLRDRPAPLRRPRSGPLRADWLPVVIVLAAATMTLGNLVAISQDNVKRMLAYSSIAHTGYILVGLAAYAGRPAERPGRDSLLRRGLHLHEHGGLRRRRGPAAAARRLQPDRHVRRPGPQGSVARGA